MANYEIKSYVKLICIRVDHFESYIVDEVNTVSTERIKEFFDKYQEKPELKIIAFQMDGCEVITMEEVKKLLPHLHVFDYIRQIAANNNKMLTMEQVKKESIGELIEYILERRD